MADIKISALPGASTLDGTETIPLVQGGVTKKATASAVWAMINPSYTGTLTGGAGVVNLGSGQFVKDASGNVGLGVTPSAWLSGCRSLDISAYSSFGDIGGSTVVANNAYRNSGGGWVYKNTNAATVMGTDSGSFYWYTAPSGTAGNAISWTQAMTLDASGNLLVGATSGSAHSFRKNNSSDYALNVVNGSASNPLGVRIYYDGLASGGNAFLNCIDTGASRLIIAGTGNVTNVNNSYGAISDAKLKDNITDVNPKLAKLMQVRIVNYTLKSDPDKTKLIGVVAQELEKVSPGLIEETKDYEEVKKTREVEVPAIEAVDAVLDEEGNVVTPAVEAVPATTRTEEYTERVDLGTTTKSVKYSVFVPMLIKAVQEQQTQIESLATRLAALEAK